LVCDNLGGIEKLDFAKAHVDFREWIEQGAKATFIEYAVNYMDRPPFHDISQA
jgi:hypothetical protein